MRTTVSVANSLQPQPPAALASTSLALHPLDEAVLSGPLFAANWYHTLFGVFVPSCVLLLRRNVCRCSTVGCSCDHASLVVPSILHPLLEKQFALLPNVSIVAPSSATMLARGSWSYLDRCDETLTQRWKVPRRRLQYLSYLLPCLDEREAALGKARGLVGGLLQLDLSASHPNLHSAVVLLRSSSSQACRHVDNPRDELAPDGPAHQQVCLRETDSGYKALRSLLHSHGVASVEVVQPDQLSFEEQARVVAGASVIVAPHGAAEANLLFARPGSLVVELTPYLDSAKPCNVSLAACVRETVERQRLQYGRHMYQLIATALGSKFLALPIVDPTTLTALRAAPQLYPEPDWERGGGVGDADGPQVANRTDTWTNWGSAEGLRALANVLASARQGHGVLEWVPR